MLYKDYSYKDRYVINPAIFIMSIIIVGIIMYTRLNNIAAGIGVFMSSILILISMSDNKYMIIPNEYNIIYLFIVLIYFYIFNLPYTNAFTAIVLGILLIFFSIYSHGAIGMGDVKLITISCIMFGLNVLYVLFIAHLLVLISLGIRFIKKKNIKHIKIPMAMYYSAGIVICYILGGR